MSEPTSRYVTCRCQHCSGNIEFDANGLDGAESLAVPCPHCGTETIITLPEQNPPLVQAMKSSRAEDYPEGMKWVRKGAALGDVEAMAHLGLANVEGIGVEKNHAEAVKWLRRAADQGNVTAQNNLGVCYLHGYGVGKDFAEAEKWIRKSAEQGDVVAQYHMGSLYHLGQGVPKDPMKAFDWWLKAAEQGHIIAQNNVGFLYDDGAIVGQDFVEAYKWMSLAAAQGYEGAKEHCSELASKMTGEQLVESKRRIESFKLTTNEAGEEEDFGIIGRLAEMGDIEAQAVLAAHLSESSGEIDYSRQAISSAVRREVWRRDEGRCVKCGGRERLEYDHIIPVSKGGSNTARNIELLCESCNRSKSDSIQ